MKHLLSIISKTQWLELDSLGMGDGCRHAVVQTLTTEAGVTYKLSFAFAARPGVADNQLRVFWDGNEVATLSLDGTSDTSWHVYEYYVVASGVSTDLMFTHLDVVDQLGTFVDDVKVVKLSTVTVDAVDNGDSLAVPIDWETEAPAASGTGTTLFSIPTSIGDVTLTAPATHIADSTLYMFEKWVVFLTGPDSCTNYLSNPDANSVFTVFGQIYREGAG